MGAAALVVIIVGLAIRRGEAVERFGFAVERQLRVVQNLALRGGTGQRIAVEHLERVAGFDLALEVDVIGKDAGEFGGDVVRDLVVFGSAIEA